MRSAWREGGTRTALRFEEVRVAVLSAMETVNPRVPSTIEAAALCKMADRGQITGGILDGPLARDNAISPEAAEVKESHRQWPQVAPEHLIFFFFFFFFVLIVDHSKEQIVTVGAGLARNNKSSSIAIGYLGAMSPCPARLPSRARTPASEFANRRRRGVEGRLSRARLRRYSGPVAPSVRTTSGRRLFRRR